ncbi:MAG TPA: alpha-amylase/4-alpha-glucanotransferase domain-containing protein, partial [Patescibacteria group bacterium]|nr:alpha-amylase/4-alpha-glucanotransferase domain-containing protein [Patescibacteria group bacterium]
RITLALVLHNHQPVGNFGWVIAEAYERAYQPMVAALERHPGVHIGLHYTGPLLDWIRAERPEFLDRLAALVGRDQVELLGGGYYEPVLAAIPERDRVRQLVRMADEVERIGGRRPAGMWLAERVWEPALPTSIVDGGYRWTIVDDTHFRAAGLDSELWGPYITDDQGRLLTVFGSQTRLRYAIPFGPVEDLIDQLVTEATPAGERLALMGDDGEKFGAWPDTNDHCWGPDGWVERFFTALEAEPRIQTTTPTAWLQTHRTVGRIYLPTSSYLEMGEWVLPADQGSAFAAALHEAQRSGAPWGRWLRGGFWRNFQVKYREVNDLHKQMLRASAKVDAMPAGASADLARDHLLRGQSNDCYWHGVFGGIYIAHMRLATHEHLIAAEDLADLAGSRATGLDPVAVASETVTELIDADLDGEDDVLMATAGQLVVIDPSEGGGIGTWDIRAVRHALTAVMRRRPEAYHARLLDLVPNPADGPTDANAGATVATIHDVVRSREPGLAERIHYDAYERRSGLVHLLAPGTTAAAFADGLAVERGDAVDGSYDVVTLEPGVVIVARDVVLDQPAGVVRVEKRFAIGGDRRRPTLDLDVTIENRSTSPVRLDLGVEWALTMLGGGANPAAYYRVGAARLTHDSTGRYDDLGAIASGNDDIGIEVAMAIEPAATAWWSPIETISNSEFGFERIYQGSALVFVWPLDLPPGERRSVSVRSVVEATVDRSPDELAGLEA